MVVQRFQALIPGIQRIPQQTEESERRVIGSCKDVGPVHGTSCKAEPIAELLGCGSSKFSRRMVGDYRVPLDRMADHVKRYDVGKEDLFT